VALLVALLWTLVGAPARAAEGRPIERRTLANGLQLVMQVDRSQPWVAVATVLPAGSQLESRGEAGAAALTAELLQRRPGQSGMVEAAGGERSLALHVDRAQFVDELPADRLALGLWLAGERLRSPPVGPGALEAARRRLRRHEAKARRSRELHDRIVARMRGLALLGAWPQGHGALDDLAELGRDAVLRFHTRSYAPNTAVVAVVGDFEPAQLAALAERYLGHVTARARPTSPSATPPAQSSVRSLTLKAEKAQRGAVGMGWLIPAGESGERAAAELGIELLCGGAEAPLEHELVRARGLALSFRCGVQRVGPHGLAWIVAQLPGGTKPSEVRAAIERQAHALSARAPQADQLAAAKERLRLGRLRASDGRRATAVALAERGLSQPASAALEAWFDEHQAIGGDDVQRVARTRFVRHSASVVELAPARWRSRGGVSGNAKARPPEHGVKSSKRRARHKKAGSGRSAKSKARAKRGNRRAGRKGAKRKGAKRKGAKRKGAKRKGAKKR
jgi:zinc protease